MHTVGVFVEEILSVLSTTVCIELFSFYSVLTDPVIWLAGISSFLSFVHVMQGRLGVTPSAYGG